MNDAHIDPIAIGNFYFVHPLALLIALILILIYPVRAFIRRGQRNPTPQPISRPDVACLLAGTVLFLMLMFG